MTGYDIQNAMYRAFGLSSQRDVDTIETVDVTELRGRLARILTLFSFATRGSL